MTYEDIIDEILESEGAEVNEADGKDKDGNPIPSKFGVLQTTLNWFHRDWFHRVKPSAIPTSVYDLTADHAREFYQWWVGERSGAMDVPSWFSYMLADFYTQSGGHAIKLLQEKAGVPDDGAWGPDTKRAVDAMFAELEGELETNPYADNEFVNWYDGARRDFIRSLKRDDEKGIMARLDKVLRITLEAVEKNDTVPIARPVVAIEIPEEFQDITPPEKPAPSPEDQDGDELPSTQGISYPISDEMLSRIENNFTYHAPKEDQVNRYQLIREAAKQLHLIICANSPPSREQSCALTSLEEAVFWTNAAITRNE